MITVVNAPATMSTFSQRHLVAGTVHVVQPDRSCAAAVVLAQIQTGSPVCTHYTTSCHVDSCHYTVVTLRQQATCNGHCSHLTPSVSRGVTQTAPQQATP